jgi:CheY-like chemotaxis protein
MNGFEVAAALQSDEATSWIPLVVLTARDLTIEERATLNGKIAALLAKGTTSPSTLLETVRRLESRGGPTRS